MTIKTIGVATTLSFFAFTLATAQDAKQEKIAQIKESIQKNQAALKTYTWNEQTQISYKGEVKSTKNYSVVVGPNGKDQKTSLDPPAPPPQPEGRRGRLKADIKDKKVDEIKQYMQQAQQLISQYVPPSGAKIQAAAQAGKVSVSEPDPGSIQLTIQDYVQPGDSMVLTFNKAAKALTSLAVNSYLGEQKDVVSLQVTFAKLPDGTNHVATTNLVAKAKDITVYSQNLNYQKL
jgi:hypothetical protein